MYQNRETSITCDTCERREEGSEVPKGWYLVARMKDDMGCWDEAGEWHFDSIECLRRAVAVTP